MPFVFLLFFVIACMVYVNLNNTKINELTTSEFIANLDEAKIINLGMTNKFFIFFKKLRMKFLYIEPDIII